jgi:SAM-dependent methyltransferase
MFDLLQGLHEIRRDIPRDEWRQFCKETVPNHHLAKMIHQDPFTLHSVRKPRGYPGDAALLDFIYGRRTAPTTTLGERIFEFTTNTPPSRGVRSRARIIAGIIDRLARQRGSLRILSIACGHLREAEMSEAVREGKVTEYVAFDQDEESLAHVRERFPNGRVTTIRGSLGELLLGKHKGLGQFDFVYAAGLYDYLSEKLATRLTTWMFNVTAPGGVTLLTNYLPDIVGAGYMEAFMEWELIFRSPEELADTARRIPADQIADRRSYVEDNNMIAFVELLKASPTPPVLPPPVFHPVAPRRNGVQATTRQEKGINI